VAAPSNVIVKVRQVTPEIVTEAKQALEVFRRNREKEAK